MFGAHGVAPAEAPTLTRTTAGLQRGLCASAWWVGSRDTVKLKVTKRSL